MGFLIVESARCKFREQSSKSQKSSKSHKVLGIVETLAHKSHKSIELIIFNFNFNSRFPLIIKLSRDRNFQLKFFFIRLHEGINDMFGKGFILTISMRRI